MTSTEDKNSKKLISRIHDDTVLVAGSFSGLSAYFNFDSTLYPFKLFVACLIVAGGSGILIYLISLDINSCKSR